MVVFVILSVAKNLAESHGEKGLLGETKVSFVATDAHPASAQRGIPLSARDDTGVLPQARPMMASGARRGRRRRGAAELRVKCENYLSRCK